MEAHPFQTRRKELERARQAQALLDDLLALTQLTDDERACMVARRAMASKGQEVLERRAARLGMLLEDLDETLAQLTPAHSPALASTAHEFGVTWSDWITGQASTPSPPPLEALCEQLRLLRTEAACAVSKVQETETVNGDGHSSSSYSDYSDSHSVSSSASSAEEEEEDEDEASS